LDSIEFEKSTIYKIYQDQGALGSYSFYLFHKKGSIKYHFIEFNGVRWRNYVVQTCSFEGEASDSGRWVRIKRIIRSNGDKETEFDYQPKIDSLLIISKAKEKDESIYKVVNNRLRYYGKLTTYCSFYDLDSGLYYLTPPSILYNFKTDIKELENKYQ